MTGRAHHDIDSPIPSFACSLGRNDGLRLVLGFSSYILRIELRTLDSFSICGQSFPLLVNLEPISQELWGLSLESLTDFRAYPGRHCVALEDWRKLSLETSRPAIATDVSIHHVVNLY